MWWRLSYKTILEYLDKSKDSNIEKRLVSFNRNVLLSNIKSSSIPHKELILRMTN